MEKLQKLFIEKGILKPKANKLRICKELLSDDAELLNLWNSFTKNYRTEEEAWFSIIHLSTPPKCPICGNLCAFHGVTRYGNNGYKTTCGICSANKVPAKKKKFSETINNRSEDQRKQIFKKRQKTLLEKYGDENATLIGSKSFRENLKKKYGNEFYSNREAAKKTCLDRYGVECNFQMEGYQTRAVQKKLEKYGNASNYEKTKRTNLAKYGVEHIGQCKDVQQKSKEVKNLSSETFEQLHDCTSVKKLILLYGQGWKEAKIVETIKYKGRSFVKNSDIPKIEQYWKSGRCHTNGYVSKKEKEVLQFVKSIYTGPILENDTTAVPNLNHRYYELDIYLPDLGIGIDFDGNYYHSTLHKDIYYHQRKTLCCYKQGIRLAHVLEYDWDNNNSEIKSKIKKLILENASFDDGYFPNISTDIKLSEPRKRQIGNFEYYDTGVCI